MTERKFLSREEIEKNLRLELVEGGTYYSHVLTTCLHYMDEVAALRAAIRKFLKDDKTAIIKRMERLEAALGETRESREEEGVPGKPEKGK